MPKRRSRARLTPTEAEEEYLERAGKLWDDFNAWYKANREAARLGTTQPSFEVAAKTMGRLSRIGISDSMICRHHKGVTSQLEALLQKGKQEVSHYFLWKDVGAMA